MPFYTADPPNTKKEHALKAELFGLRPGEPQMSEQDMNLSASEIEKLRKLVALHDQKNRPQDLDLSKPVIVPYQYSAFPKMLYMHSACRPAFNVQKGVDAQQLPILQHVPAKLVTRVVHSESELTAAVNAGWDPKPPAFEAPAAPKEEEFDLAAWEKQQAEQAAEDAALADEMVEASRSPRKKPR